MTCKVGFLISQSIRICDPGIGRALELVAKRSFLQLIWHLQDLTVRDLVVYTHWAEM